VAAAVVSLTCAVGNLLSKELLIANKLKIRFIYKDL